ncbi:TonB-dependent receptor [bacterium]|nr:TonB-dependent receptor [bacterium]
MKRCIISLILIFLPCMLSAGITGKISGKVTETDTGLPLIGCNVFVTGMYMGAATDEEGFYFILNVPPGTYSVRVTMMGYEALEKTDVIVSIDRTVNVDFILKSTIIETEGVVVTAAREAIRKDVSFTQSVVGNEALFGTPGVKNLEDALNNQVGVLTGVKGPVIRGGWIEEIGSYVDGVSMRDNRTMSAFMGINKSAIGEVQLLTGGFSAEYGDARSGIINIATKDPKSAYSVSLEIRTSPAQQKHFGPYIYSKDNWWDYGRFQYMETIADTLAVPVPLAYDSSKTIKYKWTNEYGENIDRDNDGYADFEGWNNWAEKREFEYLDAKTNTKKKYKLTPGEAYEVWKWQHREQEKGEKIPGLSGVKADQDLNIYAHRPDWQYDFTISGPLIPGNSNISILGETGLLFSQRQVFTMYPFYVPGGGYEESGTMAKLTYRPKPEMRFTLLGTYNTTSDITDGGFHGNELFAGPGGERYMADPQGIDGISRRWSDDHGLAYNGYGASSQYQVARDLISFSLSHTLSPKTFYEANISRTHTKYDIHPFKSSSSGNEKIMYTIAGDTLILNDLIGAGDPFSHASSITGYGISGGGKGYDWSELTQWRASFGLTSQINRVLQLKLGGEINYSDMLDLRGEVAHPENHDPDIWLAGGVANWDTLGRLSNWNYYHVYPVYGALYMQNKLEYKGLILNLGLRMDVFSPTKTHLDRSDIWNPYLTEADKDSLWTLWGEGDSHPATQVKLSPRLGASFPIGVDTKLFFNYGHFYSLPSAELMYRITNYGTGLPVYRIGYPWVQMPRTIQYEFGFEWGFLRDYTFNGSTYYKDVTGDLHETEYITDDAWSPPLCKRPSNEIARVLKGFEVKFEKKIGRFLKGFASYDLVDGDSKIYGYRVKFNHDVTDAPDRLVTIYEPHWARKWPARQSAKINANLHTPQGWGPRIAGNHIFAALQLNILHQWRKGMPYIWRPDDPAQETLRQFNRRTKDYNRTDLRLSRDFRFGKVKSIFFLEISNVLNIKNMYYAFSEQDRPSNRAWKINGYKGEMSDWIYTQYMEALEKEGKKFGDDVDNPDLNPVWTIGSYEPPRHFTFGIQFDL